jgi:hypothetical protein
MGTGLFRAFRAQVEIGSDLSLVVHSMPQLLRIVSADHISTHPPHVLRQKYDGLVFRTDLDLSPLAGQDVKFILTVLAAGPASGDRAVWSNPIIARAGPTPPAPYARNFDFGAPTSMLATGYTRVTEANTYTTGAFGWADTAGLGRGIALPVRCLKATLLRQLRS